MRGDFSDTCRVLSAQETVARCYKSVPLPRSSVLVLLWGVCFLLDNSVCHAIGYVVVSWCALFLRRSD